MIIIGNENNLSGTFWDQDLYRPYSITIIAGGHKRILQDYDQARRMIINVRAPNTPGWNATENRISFASAGFKVTEDGNWPKFNGTFHIYYKSL